MCLLFTFPSLSLGTLSPREVELPGTDLEVTAARTCLSHVFKPVRRCVPTGQLCSLAWTRLTPSRHWPGSYLSIDTAVPPPSLPFWERAAMGLALGLSGGPSFPAVHFSRRPSCQFQSHLLSVLLT